jgi:glycerol uptake facilitator-like aquaporin
VTFARMFSDTFTGIHYSSVLPFIFAQFIAAAAAAMFVNQLLKNTKLNPS